jgi:flagellar secretion chaperone FliS
MNAFPSPSAMLKEYAAIGVQTGVEEASAHRLVLMLMNGALDKINAATGYVQRSDKAGKAQNISWAIAIIDGLRDSLNMEAGGEISQNLDSLYEYMTYRLAEANINDDEAILDEVHSLMMQIKQGWEGISAE